MLNFQFENIFSGFNVSVDFGDEKLGTRIEDEAGVRYDGLAGKLDRCVSFLN